METQRQRLAEAARGAGDEDQRAAVHPPRFFGAKDALARPLNSTRRARLS
jgi:hypothetical protein